MSRVNVGAILRRLDNMRVAGLLPASLKAKPQYCWVCKRRFYTASAICPDWDSHQVTFTQVQVDPLPGDVTDNRNYIGGWRGAGRAIVKGLKVDKRDRRVIGGIRSAQRVKAARARAAEAATKAQALADREVAYQAITWPDHVTRLQREAYYWTQVGDLDGPLSLSKAGKKMGITKAMVKRHADLSKKSIT
jgi:hypothetical protein